MGTYARQTFRGAVTYTDASARVAWPEDCDDHPPGPLVLDVGPVSLRGETWGAAWPDIVEDVRAALKKEGVEYQWDHAPGSPLLLLP